MKSVWNVLTAVEMEALGGCFANATRDGGVVFLHGELGAGKTTWARGLLRARGHGGVVKSPTYTLVESYPLNDGTVHHFDLYRLGDPEELEYMGVRDYFVDGALCLVEWPARGAGMIGSADITLVLTYCDGGRKLSARADSEKGREILSRVN